MGNVKAKKNGEIELLRFLFSVIVVLFHINNRLHFAMPGHFTLFAEGKIAVGFFFVLSGYLMAATAKRRCEAGNVVHETKVFMQKKLMGVLPCHLIVFVCCLALIMAITDFSSGTDLLMRVVYALPNLFLLQHSGIAEMNVITPEWYIAVMLRMMLLLYPLLLVFKESFSKIACPVICVMLIGYIIHANGMLSGGGRFLLLDSVPKAYLRGVAEMCGGIFGYEMAQMLRAKELKRGARIMLTIAEVLCYLIPLLYACSDFSAAYEGHAFFFLLAGITLTFSEVSVLGKWLNHPLIYYLGRLSLPIYYTHRLPLILYDVPAVKQMNHYAVMGITLAVTLVLSVLLDPASKLLTKAINKKLDKLQA